MQCYRGWHILLAIVALVSLLLLGLIIPLIAAALYFKYVRRKASKKNFVSGPIYIYPPYRIASTLCMSSTTLSQSYYCKFVSFTASSFLDCQA